MGLEKIYGNRGCKVMKAEIPAGSRMPVHHATSEAFVMVTKGKAELIYSDKEEPLHAGIQVCIPKGKPHTLQVTEDFEAFIVIGGAASIEFTGKTLESREFASAI